MISSIDGEKKKHTFNKIQQLFMTKALRKLTTKGNFLKLLKNIYKIVTTYTILNDKMNACPTGLEKRKGCLHSSLPFSMVLEILASAMKQEIKDILERRNATVFADNMIVYGDDLK